MKRRNSSILGLYVTVMTNNLYLFILIKCGKDEFSYLF